MVLLGGYYYRSRRGPGGLLIKILLVLLLFFLVFIFLMEVFLRPVFFGLAEAEALRIANRAIYETVRAEVEAVDYGDLISYQENQSGEIVYMQVNHGQISRFLSSITLEIQDRLDLIKKEGTELPLAQLLGMQVLAGFGPRMKVSIIPFGVADATSLHDSFEAVGINQVRHRIYLEVNPRLKIVVPFMEEVVEVRAEVPVTEVTIMGRVPEVYVNLDQGLFPARQ